MSQTKRFLGYSQYEQERFTYKYSEGFEDDCDNVDKFTDEYRGNFTDSKALLHILC